MFSQGGLSLEQAPPISVVLRFFITGGIFGVIFFLLCYLYKGDRIFPMYHI